MSSNRAGLAVFLIVVLTSLHACAGPMRPPLKPGDYDRTLKHGGLERTYLLHVPAQYDGTRALPLVFMFHGGFGSAENAARDYGWREKADAAGFIAVFPQGTGMVPTWNAVHCCGAALRNDVDDVGFVLAMLDQLRAELRIDLKRVYATGMSNGAMFCHRLAAEHGERFAAIAPVAGTIGGQANARAPVKRPLQPRHPVAVIIFHGIEDQHVLFAGGTTVKGAVVGRVDISAEESARFWAEANHCEPEPKREDLAGGLVHRSTWTAKTGHADVVLYAIEQQGHAWPGGRKPWRGADEPSNAIRATDVIWDFFQDHPR